MSGSELESINSPCGSDAENEIPTGASSGRAPSFTSFEKSLLVDLVGEKKSTIECKRQDATSNHQKAKAWKYIAEKFSSDVLCQKRNQNQLRRAYENLKRRSKKEVSAHTRELRKTGGGLGKPPLSQTTEKLLGMIPEQMKPLENLYDCDGEMSVTISQPDKRVNEGKCEKRPKVTFSKLAKMNAFHSSSTSKTCEEGSSKPDSVDDADDNVIIESQNFSKSAFKSRIGTASESSKKTNHRDKLFENEELEHQLRKRKLEMEIDFLEQEHNLRMEVMRSEHSLRAKILELEYKQKSLNSDTDSTLNHQ